MSQEVDTESAAKFPNYQRPGATTNKPSSIRLKNQRPLRAKLKNARMNQCQLA